MSRKRFFKELFRALLIGLIIFLLQQVLNWYYNDAYVLRFDRALLERFLASELYALLIYFGNMLVIRYLLNRYKGQIFTTGRMITAVLGSAMVTLLMIFLAEAILAKVIGGNTFEGFLRAQNFNDYRNTLILSLFITAVFYLFYYYKYKKDIQVTRQQVIAGAATAQFDALKNQLDPHFLFNSLNVLSSLIEENPDAAQNFTTGLSKIYRYVLEQKNKELVSLDEELQFARTYIRLLKMRFEDGIRFEIPEAASDPQYKVVPLSLQLLLENAVKHNRVDRDSPLVIRIVEKDGYLEVVNNLQPKQVLKKGSGVGLKNIADRYALLTNKQMSKNRSSKEFVVRIPMLSKKVSSMEIQKEYIEDRRYLKAKERVEQLKGFYWNAISFIVVIPFLAWINYQTTSFPWIIFPILGWGFGLVVHGMEAYGYNPIWGKRWEERKIREIMEQEEKQKNMYR